MKYTLFYLCTLLSILGIQAQEALFNAQNINSPEVKSDQSVVFRIYAPQAQEVRITGDFLPTEKVTTPYGEADAPIKALMTKDQHGLWVYETTALAPELYSYSVIVDGYETTDPNNPFYIRDVASTKNIFLVAQDFAADYAVQDVPHGTLAHRWYDAPGLGMDRRLTIYTPAGYEQSGQEYPVLYLLHGAGGDEEAWMTLGRTTQIMDNLIAQGKAKPMIVVMPNGNVIQDAAPGAGHQGYYKPQFMIPGTMNGQYEASFPDIVHFVESQYRVKKDKAHRAIAGLSMGGFHAMHISRLYPNTYDYVGLFSAAIMPRADQDAAGVYQNIDQTLEVQKANGTALYWIAIGKTDFLYQANVDFRQKLDALGMPYVYRESEGGHIWRNWRIYLREFVPKLFE
ncbi:MAG: esterase [Flavobacteriaceae bacterium]|jgi:enterochelin esterase family protein